MGHIRYYNSRSKPPLQRFKKEGPKAENNEEGSVYVDPPVFQLKSTQDNTNGNSNNHVVQKKGIFEMIQDAQMTPEEKKEKEAAKEAEALKQQVAAAEPDVIRWFGEPQYISYKFTEINDEAALQKRNKYFKEQFGKLQLYLNVKKELLPRELTPLEWTKIREASEYISNEMTTPLSLSGKYTKLFQNKTQDGLVEEALKIDMWIKNNPGHPDGERMMQTGRKIMDFIELAKNIPAQNAIDLKYNRRYLILNNDISRSDLAFLVFGDASLQHLFTNFQNSDPGAQLHAGQSVFYPEGQPMTAVANTGIYSKGIIRTNGEIDQMVSSELLEINLGKESFKIPANYYRSFAKERVKTAKRILEIEKTDGIKGVLEIYNEHKRETNRVVRFISHGGSGSFDTGLAKKYMNEIDAFIQSLDSLDMENISVADLQDCMMKRDIAKSYDKIIRDNLQAYMNEGIEGAETAVKVLNVVKEVGQTAASFIPGVGLVSGLAFDTASQISEIANGVSDGWDFKRSGTQAALGVVNKFGGKYLDKVPGIKTLATKGFAGKFGSEMAKNTLLSPAQTMTEKLISTGDVSMDDIMSGLKDNFSVKNLATTAIGLKVESRGNKSKMGLGSSESDTAFGSKTLAGKSNPANNEQSEQAVKSEDIPVNSDTKSEIESIKDPTSGVTSVEPPSKSEISETMGDTVAKEKNKPEGEAQKGSGENIKQEDLQIKSPQDESKTTDNSTEKKLDAKRISDENADVLKENPQLKERLDKIDQMPDGPVKQEGLLEILREINAQSAIIEIQDLPPDSTIFDPQFKKGGTTDEIYRHESFMRESYRQEVESNRKAEVALMRNMDTGQMVVIKGHEKKTNTPASSKDIMEMVQEFTSGDEHWELISHSHPVGENGVASDIGYYPSGSTGDFNVLKYDSQKKGNVPVSSTIDIMTPDGPKKTHFGYDPGSDKPFWTKTYNPHTKKYDTQTFSDIHQYELFLMSGFDRKGQKVEKAPTSSWDEKTNPDIQVGSTTIEDQQIKNPDFDDPDKTPPMGIKLKDIQAEGSKMDNSRFIEIADQLVDKDGYITIYHGSVKGFTGLSQGGFSDKKGGATYFSTDKKAAKDAIKEDRVELETKPHEKRDPGLIEIKLTKEEYIQLLQMEGVRGRDYAGFHGSNLTSSEFLLTSPEAFAMVNKALLRERERKSGSDKDKPDLTIRSPEQDDAPADTKLLSDMHENNTKYIKGEQGDLVSSDDFVGYCGLARDNGVSSLIESAARSGSSAEVFSYQVDGHAFNIVKINGTIYIADSTFRQFVSNEVFDPGMAPDPNVRMTNFHADQLFNSNEGTDLARTITSQGFIALNPNTAELYGRGIGLSGRDLSEFIINISSQQDFIRRVIIKDGILATDERREDFKDEGSGP